MIANRPAVWACAAALSLGPVTAIAGQLIIIGPDSRIRPAPVASPSPAARSALHSTATGAGAEIDEPAASALSQAQSLWRDQKPTAALAALPAAGQATSDTLNAQIEFTRALLLSADGKLAQAVQALANRGQFLSGPDVSLNRNSIWDLLAREKLSRTHLAEAARLDLITQGWIDLAGISQMAWSNAEQREQAIARWSERYAPHPAEPMVAAIQRQPTGLAPAGLADANAPLQPGLGAPVTAAALLFNRLTGASIQFAPALPTQPLIIAAVLPLSGRHAESAEAVLAGLQEGAEGMRAIRDAPVVVWPYDSGGDPDRAEAQLAVAIGQGANVAVGPLTREEVARAPDMSLDIPIVALNYIHPAPDPLQYPAFVSLGLSPEDDARAAARELVAQGTHFAAVVRGTDDWSRRVADAFAHELELRGGHVVSNKALSGTADAKSRQIRTALRAEPLTDSSGKPLQHAIPTMSGQIQAVFVAMRPSAAGLVVPLLRYWGATQVPIMTVQATPQGANDHDLRNVRVCGGTGPADDTQIDGHYSHLNNDLFALGQDAARIAAHLAYGDITPGFSYDGRIGRIHFDETVGMRSTSCKHAKPLTIAKQS